MNQLFIESINANKTVQEGQSLCELCKKEEDPWISHLVTIRQFPQ